MIGVHVIRRGQPDDHVVFEELARFARLERAEREYLDRRARYLARAERVPVELDGRRVSR